MTLEEIVDFIIIAAGLFILCYMAQHDLWMFL